MMSLTLLVIVGAMFVALAVRNWHKQIGAGPTILIIGSILVFAFGAVKYGQYDAARDTYNSCVARVDRSFQGYAFNSELVRILEEELPDRPFAGRLRSVMLEPIDIATCGTEPQFMIPFDQPELEPIP